MKLIYLASTKPDLAWLRTYYESTFPEGAAKAAARYLKTVDILQRNPQIGRPTGQDRLRKLIIPGTPFSIFYQLREDRIEIVRVWDQRSDPARLDLQEEAAAFA